MTYSVSVQYLIHNNCSVYISNTSMLRISHFPQDFIIIQVSRSLFTVNGKKSNTQGIHNPKEIIKVSVIEIKEKIQTYFLIHACHSMFLTLELEKVGSNSLVDLLFISTVSQMDKWTRKIPFLFKYISDSFPWVLTLKQNSLIKDMEEIRRNCLPTY